ncbi:MAG: hypothetical protein ABIO55_04415 [Ginsengibacter sp.]
MRKLITPGRMMFALGIIALGILQFFIKDFIIGRPPSPPWSSDIPGKLAWAYISAICIIIAALAIIIQQKAISAALFIALIIIVCSFLLRHLPDTFGNTFEGIVWRINAYKSLALAGGAFIVAASFLKAERSYKNKIYSRGSLVFSGCVLIALFMFMSGLAHFKFDEFVKNFIPSYIPAHGFWTYFAAVALMAGGAGLIFRITRKWAALFSAIMILLWFLLLHIPRTVAAPKDFMEWMGIFESFAFSGILFVLSGLSSQKEI